MSQPNQYTSDKARASKAETTGELRKVVTANQEVVSHSHKDKMWFSQRDTEAFNRVVEIDQMIASLSAEKADLEKCRRIYEFASEVFNAIEGQE